MVERPTGLANGGYDPVAFYTDRKPLPGGPVFELPYGGAVWRFANFGIGQLSPHGPAATIRSVSLAAWPWPGGPMSLISGGRLFLFCDSHRLEIFAADPERIADAAERKWPTVLATVSPGRQ